MQLNPNKFEELVTRIVARYPDENRNLVYLWVDIVEDTSDLEPTFELYEQDRKEALGL